MTQSTPQAAIEAISIGEELLLGQTLDTNANWIAGSLYDVGLKLERVQTVGDEPEEIRRALEIAASRSGYVVITGGLGPTEDDLTIETAAKHFANLNDLFILAVETDGLGESIRWETSRGGALFPHLYAPLAMDRVLWAAPVPLRDGVHVFPERMV